MSLNISQTMVAVMTRASEQEAVDRALLHDLSVQLEGTTRQELLAVIAALASVNNQALSLLEQNTRLTKADFLRDLGQFFAENPEE